MTYNNIQTELADNILTVMISRPKKLNALNIETIKELHDVFDTSKNNETIKVIILTGSGEKAFVAGADIAEFADYTVDEGVHLASTGQKILFDFIENFPKPVIAAINGFALKWDFQKCLLA